MMTMRSEAAMEYTLVRDLLNAGMDAMRINCAHDDATAWHSMVETLRRAEKEVGRRCRILMDLAGPKIADWEDRRGKSCRSLETDPGRGRSCDRAGAGVAVELQPP
jgi:hypothetical protein